MGKRSSRLGRNCNVGSGGGLFVCGGPARRGAFSGAPRLAQSALEPFGATLAALRRHAHLARRLTLTISNGHPGTGLLGLRTVIPGRVCWLGRSGSVPFGFERRNLGGSPPRCEILLQNCLQT
jgi:hypothetical protein